MNSVHAVRFVLLVVFGMVAFRAAADSPPPLELTAANLASVIDPLMAEWVDKRKGPGAVVVVVNRDGPVFAKGYGFADIEARRPFTADATLVRPGSISKLFTGIAVMQLVDTDKLDLDRDVNGYLDFAIPTPEGGVPVTLRRLLTHRAGFEEHWKGQWSREPEPLGPWLARNLPRRLFPKGDVEAYSNYGAALAGYVVERVSGEPFAWYVQRHILDPLGMSRSTFRQPIPDNFAPQVAKGYRASDQPPLAFFEIVTAPSGALSATGTDMGRFIRMLMNGGELDGARILPKARLDEMMAPNSATPAGYLGLAFFGTKVAGHDSIGHDGRMLTFSSELTIFLEQGVGIFASLNGIGEITEVRDLRQKPHPVAAIAERFLPKVPEAADVRATAFSSNTGVAGVYHSSRRAESSWVRLNDLFFQTLIKVDNAGNARVFFALWPFDELSVTLKRIERNLYEGPTGGRTAFIEDAGSESYLAAPAGLLQRVPWSLDVRWIAPAFAASATLALVTLVAWPIGALWRYWRKRRWSQYGCDRHKVLATRLVLLIDVVVIVATLALFTKRGIDPRITDDALDPLMLALYALAWLGVFGAALTAWFAATFWRKRVGSRWSRIHHTLIAASAIMLAWFFVTFRIAGTTLIY